MRRPSVFLFVPLCLGISLIASALPAQDASAYKTDPKFTSAISDGKKLTRDRQYGFAIDAYKKACKIANGKDVDALTALLKLQMNTGAYKDAVKTSVALNEIARYTDS